MKTVTPYEIEVAGRYVVTQTFSNGETATVSGICTKFEDDFITFLGIAEPVNIHPHVGMPDVHISEF